MKYKAFEHVFEDKQVNLKLRFKLFDSIISPTLMYGVETTPLTLQALERINIVQRSMPRKMVGWICCAEDSWEDRGRRMSARLARCLQLHPVKKWSEAINERKAKLSECEVELPYWTRLALGWNPFECSSFNRNSPYRVRGHPHQRWDDTLF